MKTLHGEYDMTADIPASIILDKDYKRWIQLLPVALKAVEAINEYILIANTIFPEKEDTFYLGCSYDESCITPSDVVSKFPQKMIEQIMATDCIGGPK